MGACNCILAEMAKATCNLTRHQGMLREGIFLGDYFRVSLEICLPPFSPPHRPRAPGTPCVSLFAPIVLPARFSAPLSPCPPVSPSPCFFAPPPCCPPAPVRLLLYNFLLLRFFCFSYFCAFLVTHMDGPCLDHLSVGIGCVSHCFAPLNRL